MLKSKEIRWFMAQPNPEIIRWFEGRGQNWENISPRTDFYLSLNTDDLSFKLREGKLEIKKRVAEGGNLRLTPYGEGKLEYWQKWSFSADSEDKLASQILKNKFEEWLEVQKVRMGVKIAIDEEGKSEIFNIQEKLTHGCQMEYTRISLRGQVYYSFALEWFGEKEVTPEQVFFEEILKDTRLNVSESKGYAAFIKSAGF